MSNEYTYDELVAAAAGSRTIREVVLKLGREPSQSRNRYVMGLLRQHGIDRGHIDNQPRLYTREMLAEAAAASSSIVEVVRRLGAKEVGGTEAYIGRQLRRYEIDISHFETLNRNRTPRPTTLDRPKRTFRRFKHVPDAEFAAAVAQARSIAECSRLMGVSDSGWFRQRFLARADELNIDTSHMLGQAHARGGPGTRTLSAAQVLVKDPDRTRRVPGHVLRAAMAEVGIPYCCAICGIGPEWHGRTITLEVDHINGDFIDNRQENLRHLCPNCHATTPTFCRKKAPWQHAVI